MNNSEFIQNFCLGVFGVFAFTALLLMFSIAVWKGELVFHGGYIRGKLARAVGVIGILGLISGTYLAVPIIGFNLIPPLALLAVFFFGLFVVTVLALRFLSIFFFHPK